ncbi:MAG: hypothetical protein QXJ64_07665, partial [Thermosphaera sp.]
LLPKINPPVTFRKPPAILPAIINASFLFILTPFRDKSIKEERLLIIHDSPVMSHGVMTRG